MFKDTIAEEENIDEIIAYLENPNSEEYIRILLEEKARLQEQEEKEEREARRRAEIERRRIWDKKNPGAIPSQAPYTAGTFKANSYEELMNMMQAHASHLEAVSKAKAEEYRAMAEAEQSIKASEAMYLAKAAAEKAETEKLRAMAAAEQA